MSVALAVGSWKGILNIYSPMSVALAVGSWKGNSFLYSTS
jgi:hypothetical protein